MNNGSSNNRLDRIENILDRLAVGLEETKAIANSNSRAIQAMMEQQATERLRHEERMASLEENLLETRQNLVETKQLMARMAETQSGLTKILIHHDEDRPTILRRLMAIENKVDRILERDSE